MMILVGTIAARLMAPPPPRLDCSPAAAPAYSRKPPECRTA